MNEKAECENYQLDFEKGLNTLEDIQLLSEFSVSPLVSHAYFYLSEIKRKADALLNGQIHQFGAVEKVLDDKLTAIVADFFGNTNRFKSYNYEKLVEKVELKKWNLAFETIPEILSVVTLFNYHGAISIYFDNNSFQITGLILEDGNFELNRKFIYVITRKLLRNKVLLTFNLEKSSRTGLLKLTLKADLSHDDSYVYKVHFKAKHKGEYVVGFSNVLQQYRASLEEIQLAGEHNIVEITNDLTVKHYVGLPELSRMEIVNKEILHFSFLFRPLSLILPMKGHLTFDNFTRSLDDENKRKQDVFTHFRTIDFFSLFNL